MLWYGPYSPARLQNRLRTNAKPMYFDTEKLAIIEINTILKHFPPGTIKLKITEVFIFNKDPAEVKQQFFDTNDPAIQKRANETINLASTKLPIEQEEILAMELSKYELLLMPVNIN